MEPAQSLLLYNKPLLSQNLRGSLHRRRCLRRRFSQCFTLQNPNSQSSNVLFPQSTHRHGRRQRIPRVRPRQDFKQSSHICSRPRHRANHSDPTERTSALRKMSRSRNPSRRRLQSANSAKMRRHAHRSTAIASHSPYRAARSNHRRLSTTRSPRRPLQVPRIARLAAQGIVSLICHQIFGRIRISQYNPTRRTQPRYKRRIRLRDIIFPQQRPRRRRPSSRINAALNRQRDAMQRSPTPTMHHCRLGSLRLLQRTVSIKMYKCIQLWLQL